MAFSMLNTVASEDCSGKYEKHLKILGILQFSFAVFSLISLVWLCITAFSTYTVFTGPQSEIIRMEVERAIQQRVSERATAFYPSYEFILGMMQVFFWSCVGALFVHITTCVLLGLSCLKQRWRPFLFTLSILGIVWYGFGFCFNGLMLFASLFSSLSAVLQFGLSFLLTVLQLSVTVYTIVVLNKPEVQSLFQASNIDLHLP